MQINAGTMSFDLPDDWQDHCAYEYKSPDGQASVQVRREHAAEGATLDGMIADRVRYFSENMPRTRTGEVLSLPLGSVEARAADLAVRNDDGSDMHIRMIIAEPESGSVVSILCMGTGAAWDAVQPVLRRFVESFELQHGRERTC